MKRIGIYGGAFNPPHVGHVRGAQHLMQVLQLDRLVLMPSCVSPHKALLVHSPTPIQRLQMLQIAAADLADVTVSDLELHRGGVSYTVDTLAQMQAMDPDARLVLCMGTDMFLSFMDWREPERILKMADLAVLYRGMKEEQEQVARQKRALEQLGATVHTVENPVTEISSTDLRRLVSFGCTDAFLPEGVGQYIRDHQLYGFGQSYRNLPIEQLEEAVISLLKPSRVKHVLGCRQTAVELARHWGADEVDAARAGLLHDITKALDGPLQLTLCRAHGTMLDDFSTQNPKTLHALTGALVAQTIFGENDAVVSAIRSHTTGKANMNLLENIIYVADYMEPNRDFPGVGELRDLAFSDIDLALKTGLEMTIAMLRLQKREISRESQEALEWLDSMKKTPEREDTIEC